MKGPRIIYMGTPEFAVPALAVCAELGRLVAVVTQPDRPVGRTQTLTAPPVKRWALERELPVFQPQRIKGTLFHEELASLHPDVIVVAAYGRLLPPDLLAVPPAGCVNLHASLLPKYRGAAPIQWAIANGESETGVCLMRMEAGLDTGPVIARSEMPIFPDATGGSLHDALSLIGADLLREALPRYLAGELVPVPQDHANATYAPALKKEDGQLDLSMPARALDCRVRAFNPWPGTSVQLGATPVKVHRVYVGNGHGEPGALLSATHHGIELACREGSLVITELQPEGRKRMSAGEYLAGYRTSLIGQAPHP